MYLFEKRTGIYATKPAFLEEDGRSQMSDIRFFEFYFLNDCLPSTSLCATPALLRETLWLKSLAIKPQSFTEWKTELHGGVRSNGWQTKQLIPSNISPEYTHFMQPIAYFRNRHILNL